MASSQLSPKKYIETRVRALPVYKCLVTKQWKEAGEADVIVMRKHVNGNVTVGFYLVDLMCLGIKDTFFMFNEPEAEVYDRFPTEVDAMFDEVDYALAHNIIYAGHDFALDYGIEPAKEFAVTKYILEEDNEAIPLIDIPVGDEDGLPHLIVHQPGEHSGALAKLAKIAGEGNYRYTVTGISQDDFEDDELEDEDDEFEAEDSRIANYELGSISPHEAQYLSTAELTDFEKGLGRTAMEKTTLVTEESLRRLYDMSSEYDFTFEETEEYFLFEDIETLAFDVTKEEEEFYLENIEPLFKKGEDNAVDASATADMLDRYADRLLIVAAVFEYECNRNGSFAERAKSLLQDLQAYPLAKLDLALANLLEDEPAAGFETIYQEKDIHKLFPEAAWFGEKDLAVFWLIQTLLNLRKGDLKAAVRSYNLFCETDTINFMMSLVQIELNKAINRALQMP